MAERMGKDRGQGRPGSGKAREPMTFSIDGDLYDLVKATPNRSDLVNRLLRAELVPERDEAG